MSPTEVATAPWTPGVAGAGPVARSGPAEAARRRGAAGAVFAVAAAGVDARACRPMPRSAPLVVAADRSWPGTGPSWGTPRTDSADPDWFYDPLTGRRAPGAAGLPHPSPGRDRDGQHQAGLGDVPAPPPHRAGGRLVADPGRALRRGRRRSAAVLVGANPFLTGVHWTSGIEAGIRLISWTWTRRLLDDWPKVGDLFEHNDDAVRQIGWHQEFLAAFPSRGSSANNHVDRRGGRPAGRRLRVPVVRPEPRVAAPARRRCWSGSSPPTPSTTVSTASWRPTTTASCSSSGCGRRRGRRRTVTRCPRRPGSAWRRCWTPAAAMVDVTGRPPRQGDGDEGRPRGGRPGPRPVGHRPVHRRRPAGALGWWPSFAAASRRSCARPSGGARQLPRPAERPGRFPDAGLVPALPRRGRSGDLVPVRRRPARVPVDRGARPRRTPCRWRCGTTASTSSPTRAPTATTANRPGGSGSARRRAHNTIEVGGVSQSESGGPFLWNSRPGPDDDLSTSASRPVQTWSAEHDGYQRLRPDGRTAAR